MAFYFLVYFYFFQVGFNFLKFFLRYVEYQQTRFPGANVSVSPPIVLEERETSG